MEENKKNKFPNVPNLRFGGSTVNLSKCLIEDMFLFLKTNSLSREELSYDYGSIKNIHYGDILTKYPILLDTTKNKIPFILDGIILGNKKDYLLTGDIVIADTAEDYLVGKAIEIQNPENIRIVSGLHTIAIRPKKLFANGFLGFYFNSAPFKKRCYPAIQGIKVYSISKSALLRMTICYPDIIEQEKISRTLVLLDLKIDVQNKILEKLESLKIGIKEKVYLLGKEKESFGKILNERSEKSTLQNQYPVLSSTVKGLFLQSEYFDRSVSSDNNVGYKIVHKDQIIISPQNLWMGNLTFNDKYESGIVSPSYKIYDIDKKYSKRYIYWLLTSKRSFFNYGLVSEQGASIVRRNLNLDAFMELCLPVIKDTNMQEKIEKLINLIEKKIEAEKKRGDLLNQQKSFLLSNLFI